MSAYKQHLQIVLCRAAACWLWKAASLDKIIRLTPAGLNRWIITLGCLHSFLSTVFICASIFYNSVTITEQPNITVINDLMIIPVIKHLPHWLISHSVWPLCSGHDSINYLHDAVERRVCSNGHVSATEVVVNGAHKPHDVEVVMLLCQSVCDPSWKCHNVIYKYYNTHQTKLNKCRTKQTEI